MEKVTIRETGKATLFSGVTQAAVPAFVESEGARSGREASFIVAPDFRKAEAWAEDILFFAQVNGRRPEPEVLILPENPEDARDEPRAFDLACDRMATLTRLHDYREGAQTKGRHVYVITTPRGFFQPTPSRKSLAAKEIRLKTGGKFKFKDLIARLGGELDYYAEAVCERPGEYAVRGGLLDVYPVNESTPFRIDFFGDEIEEIRAFDPTSQRSLERVESLVITSLVDGANVELREANIFDYLPDSANWFFWEPLKLADEFPALFTYPERISAAKMTFRDLLERREPFADAYLGLAELDLEDPLFGAGCGRQEVLTESLAEYRTFTVEGAIGVDRVAAEQEARRNFLRQLSDWQGRGYSVHLVCNNEGEEQRLREILAGEAGLDDLAPSYHRGELHEGFIHDYKPGRPRIEWPGKGRRRGIVVVTDSEIFGRYRVRSLGRRRRRLPERSQVDQLLDFSELVEGDFLVHLSHGICIYRGIQKMEVRGRKDEVISLEFDEGMTLHLPLHESHLLTRYVGMTKASPKLGKLGTNQWEKARGAAEKATLDFAAELLNIQARREAKKRDSYGPDNEWQKEFEEAFVYTETPDQMTAIQDAKSDMEREQPMDRLICGDVGYGKTEVAIRAAFKAVMGGRQVAMLVPTTVLAQQHYNTFRERMADFPVVVEMLSRFRSAKQQKEIVAQLAEGKIDIAVGTHRLVSKDVKFENLGLLIIDEEHRFGVRHKERIKRMKEDVDVMTMSATPIPRTLHLALMGARDLSVIETAPVNRLPIQTVVKSYDRELVRRAIKFEVDRGGQVFYLHNRVDTIHSVALLLQEILPGLRVAVGHGQMEERLLERVMTEFVAGKYDVLVCTTIIETGLDIPNCNTLIIEGADRFGLSQLYQLRGRVGRFKRQAYAYLLLHKHMAVLDQARKRLSAIKQYNQLGAGFKIAMRDLELRGAGNLLGPQQSGFIAGVGFELYCELLRQSVARLKGEKIAETVRATVRLDFVVVGEGKNERADVAPIGFATLKEEELQASRGAMIEANLPHGYLGETRLRIDFYRRIAMARTVDEVKEIAEAMKDRFGPCPVEADNLIQLAEIRCLAEEKGIYIVEVEGNKLKLHKATGRRNDFHKIGTQFPRLAKKRPRDKLKEIRAYLGRLKRDGGK